MTEHRTYYNDFDSASSAVLRELIADGLISDGVVDDRSITEVQADDLVGFTRCHFFAGSGAWEDALDIAGWPEDWNTWIASLPCQPWSCAGKGEGCNDERHLWPVFFDLVNQCRPDFLIGEQVEAAVGKGWLDGIRLEMEGIGYAFTFVVLPACCQGEEEAILLVGEDGVREERVLVGPPHIRQRLFWGAVRVGESVCERLEGERLHIWSRESRERVSEAAGDGEDERVADMQRIQPERRGIIGNMGSSPAMQSCEEDQRERTGDAAGDCCSDVRIPDMQDTNRGSGEHGEETGIGQDGEWRRGLSGCGVDVWLQHSESNGWDERETESSGRGAPCGCGLRDDRMDSTQCPKRRSDGIGRSVQERREQAADQQRRAGSNGGLWSDYSIVICRDTDKHGTHKARRIPRQENGTAQPGVLLGADGAPRVMAPDGTPGAVSTFPIASKEAWKGSRVGLLRLAGNAINPKVAAVFIEEFMAAIMDMELEEGES